MRCQRLRYVRRVGPGEEVAEGDATPSRPSGLPSDQFNNQIYQSDQSIQIRYRILSDQSTQIQASIHLTSLGWGAATLDTPDYPYVPAPERVALPEKLRCYRGQPS